MAVLRVRENIRDVVAQYDVEFAGQLAGDGRRAAHDRLDLHVQALGGKQVPPLGDIERRRVGDRDRADGQVCPFHCWRARSAARTSPA